MGQEHMTVSAVARHLPCLLAEKLEVTDQCLESCVLSPDLGEQSMPVETSGLQMAELDVTGHT